MMQSREEWQRKLDQAADKVGANLGYHLVYGPWSTIERAKTAFVSANPGKRTNDGRDRLVSDERGNSFAVEAQTTLSPLTAQFLKWCQLIDTSPDEVLTGTSNPFRTESEMDLSSAQKQIGRELSHEFWSECLALNRIRKIVVTSNSARDLIIRIVDGRLEEEFLSGWGNTKIRKYFFGTNGVVVHLPQLSRYKLFSRSQCRDPLRRAFAP